MSEPVPRHTISVAGVVWSAIAGAAVAALLWYLGVEVYFSIALGLLIVALCVVWAAFRGSATVPWPITEQAPTAGTRSDVARLAWAFRTHRGSVREPAIRAVRELASRRLARHGLDLAAEADRDKIVATIGSAAYDALVAPGGILPSAAALSACLDALDALDRLGIPTKKLGTPSKRTGHPTP
jgi:hypothetical protein